MLMRRNEIKCVKNFILKACKLFRMRVDSTIEKNLKMVAILNKFTVLCLSSDFVVYIFKLELILFYN